MEEKEKAGCETCIDYIKRMKRLEFDLQVEREERVAFEFEVRNLQTKVAEMEEEGRDQVICNIGLAQKITHNNPKLP